MRREMSYYWLRPTNLLLFLTYRCTSRCRTCRMWQRKAHHNELSLEGWQNFIDTAGNHYNIENVEMFGGDALLRKDVLIPLIEYTKRCAIPSVNLATNCNLIDEDTARALVNTGINAIFVSLDGMEELHDKIRGVPGSFERTKRGLEYLIKAKNGQKNPLIIVNSTISSLNVDGFEKIIPFAQGLGVDVVAFEYIGEFPLQSVAKSQIEGVAPEPFYLPQDSSLLLNREQARLLKRKLKSIKKMLGTMKVHITTRNIDILTIENLEKGTFPNRRCNVCRYLITVDPYGNIIPCPFFNTYSLGNISQNQIDDIWRNARHRNFIKYVDDGRIELCKYCVLGVERNSTFIQGLMKGYFTLTKKGLDERWA